MYRWLSVIILISAGLLSCLRPGNAQTASCPNPRALGVSRVVQIDTTGGPGFGFEHFKAHDFLRPGEVVLTFDDGPWPKNTPAVLAALAAHCTKAIFFPIGAHATYEPGILKQVVAAGHAIGSHTWCHQDLSKTTGRCQADGTSQYDPKDEIEKGISAVRWAAGAPTAPYFRFPALRQPPELIEYLGRRNIAIFSTDIDSMDFKIRQPQQVRQSVMESLKKRGKGIVLLHDFQNATAEAAMDLLNDLKAGGYKIVFMQPKDEVRTLARYDALIVEKSGTPPSASNTLPSFTVPPMAAAPPQVSVPQTFPAPQPSIGRRVALVIGNSSYRPPAEELANPRNDATDMAAALRKHGFRVIVGLDLDKAAMDSKLREFESELRGAQAGVFFYAGHALQMTGKNYMIPVDAELPTESAVEVETVSLDQVQRTMQRAVPTKILFLDACRTNPYARNLQRIMGTRSVEVGRGLAPVRSGVDTLISFSTEPDTVALDGRGRNSPFTGALVRRILSAEREDLNGLLIAVRNDVIEETQDRQVPWEHSALTKAFYFQTPPR
jgi:peptidoglycan/xylan/chitin deacetylase (PgdA/CDA1 family)